MTRRRTTFALALLLAASSGGAAADDVSPHVPCAGASYPAIPALDAAPNVRLWTGAALGKAWAPSLCAGWQPAQTTLAVAAAGHFSYRGDADAMLAHIGMISSLREVRYWSVTDGRWNDLFTRATSLIGPDPGSSRGDFATTELKAGRELYFLAADNRMQKDMVTRLRVKEAGGDSIVLETANVSPLRWFTFTLVPAGDMQTLYFLDRRADGSWQFYSLTRVLNASPLLSHLVSGPSYINRAVAMYRYFAGIPTDRDPPAAP